MTDIFDRILRTFYQRGDLAYGSEAVTQRQHALQSATMAEAEQAPPWLVTAALLHDIGHILDADDLPQDDDQDLDDAHEQRGYELLLYHFGARVADPVRLHVAAKRYLCTVDPDYAGKLSPASFKSYLDQGGQMSGDEMTSFQSMPHFDEALRLRRWDDLAKDPQGVTAPLEAFRPVVESSLVGG